MQPLLGRVVERIDGDGAAIPAAGLVDEAGVLARPAQLGEVGDLVLAAGRADADDQVVDPVEPPDPLDEASAAATSP